MDKKIAIVGLGSGSTGRELAQQLSLGLDGVRPQVMVVDEGTMYDFQIDEVKYRKKDVPSAAKTMLGSMVLDRVLRRVSNLDGIALVSEYRLIQAKKSKLSAKERDLVETKFHMQYEEVQTYDCADCGGMSYSTVCENPSCPLMPCCDEPKEKCNCKY